MRGLITLTAIFVSALSPAAAPAQPPAPAAGAPRVVGAIPDNADIGVDPALGELRITFDRDMRPGSYSLCGSGPTYPKVAGQISWADPRTVVIPVQLESDHRYDFSVNCPVAQSFVSATGVPAAPYPISFKTRASGGAAPALAPGDAAAAFAALRTAIDERYSYRDRIGIDWASTYAAFEPRFRDARTPSQVGRLAAQMLAIADDPHISVQVGPFRINCGRRMPVPNISVPLLPRIVPQCRQLELFVMHSRFRDGIGYILIGTWAPPRPTDFEGLYPILDQMKDAPGIIIDVRSNTGGDELAARQFAACFVPKATVYAQHSMRDPAAPGGFTQPQQRVIEPGTTGPQYRGRVALLIGPANMSSCESFIQMMRCMPPSQIRLFGERTLGSSGNPQPHTILPDVTVYLPSWKAMDADGEPTEGRGIAPDQEIKTNPATDFKNRDPIIDAALAWLRTPPEKPEAP